MKISNIFLVIALLAILIIAGISYFNQGQTITKIKNERDQKLQELKAEKAKVDSIHFAYKKSKKKYEETKESMNKRVSSLKTRIQGLNEKLVDKDMYIHISNDSNIFCLEENLDTSLVANSDTSLVFLPMKKVHLINTSFKKNDILKKKVHWQYDIIDKQDSIIKMDSAQLVKQDSTIDDFYLKNKTLNREKQKLVRKVANLKLRGKKTKTITIVSGVTGLVLGGIIVGIIK